MTDVKQKISEQEQRNKEIGEKRERNREADRHTGRHLEISAD